MSFNKEFIRVNLPVFILPIIVLPEGITRIRVFEPRYIKLVSIASTNNGFVICALDDKNDDNKHSETIGCWVNIVNFEQGDDGVLIIDVQCKSLVSLNNMSLDDDKLLFSDVTERGHWQSKTQTTDIKTDSKLQQLSQSLRKVFDDNNVLKSLYGEQFIEEPYWVIARWLEILPLKFKDKRKFLTPDSFSYAKSLVHSVIFSDK